METITLQYKTKENEYFSASYSPSHGMNMLSFKKGDREAIDQQSSGLFE